MTSSDVLVADLASDPGPIRLWRTDDLGAHLQQGAELNVGAGVDHVQLAATQNLAALVFARGGGLFATVSVDGGCGWPEPVQIADASAANGTIGALSLAASAGGTFSLVYSVEQSGTPAGLFLMELL